VCLLTILPDYLKHRQSWKNMVEKLSQKLYKNKTKKRLVWGVETIVTFFSATGQGRVVFCWNSQEEGCHHDDFEKLGVKKSSYESETFGGTAFSLITLGTLALGRMAIVQMPLRRKKTWTLHMAEWQSTEWRLKEWQSLENGTNEIRDLCY